MDTGQVRGVHTYRQNKPNQKNLICIKRYLLKFTRMFFPLSYRSFNLTLKSDPPHMTGYSETTGHRQTAGMKQTGEQMEYESHGLRPHQIFPVAPQEGSHKRSLDKQRNVNFANFSNKGTLKLPRSSQSKSKALVFKQISDRHKMRLSSPKYVLTSKQRVCEMRAAWA